MRRAAVVWLGHEMIARLLRLPAGQKVGSIHADWLRLGIGVVVEGGDLPEVPEDEYPGSAHPAGYIDLELRAKFEAFVQRYRPPDQEMTMEEVMVLRGIREVLAGTLDPRIDMTEELRM